MNKKVLINVSLDEFLQLLSSLGIKTTLHIEGIAEWLYSKEVKNEKSTD